MFDDSKNLHDLKAWINHNGTLVAAEPIGNTAVCTAFLGVPNPFGQRAKAFPFLTLRFENGDLLTQFMTYPTWAQAEQGHKEIVEEVQESATH